MFRHLSSDLSLTRLAEVSNYSPFHFQKIFKQVKGETPKQYVIRLRLEIAAHYLIIHNKRAVSAIADECGFSSSAVFARSFKQFFGITAEEMRVLPKGKKVVIRDRQQHLKKLLAQARSEKKYEKELVHIAIKTMPSLEGFCMNTEFEDMLRIEGQIQKFAACLVASNILKNGSGIMGMIYPHNNIYRVFIPVSNEQKPPKQMHRWEIKGGTFASFIVKGEIKNVFDQIHYFYNSWLPKSGYKIAEVYGIEVFKDDVTNITYADSVRELMIPIEPA
jgi:AraC family transcriptional regulator